MKLKVNLHCCPVQSICWVHSRSPSLAASLCTRKRMKKKLLCSAIYFRFKPNTHSSIPSSLLEKPLSFSFENFYFFSRKVRERESESDKTARTGRCWTVEIDSDRPAVVCVCVHMRRNKVDNGCWKKKEERKSRKSIVIFDYRMLRRIYMLGHSLCGWSERLEKKSGKKGWKWKCCVYVDVEVFSLCPAPKWSLI